MNKINPISYFPNPTDGRPISGGKLYIGKPDTDPVVLANQKQVYALQENGNYVAISQPVYLSVGGTPAYNGGNVSLYVSGDYSIKVLTSANVQKFYVPDSSVDSSAEVGVYDDVADMTAATTTPGALYSTKGNKAAGDDGYATYISKTAAEYGGVPDGYIDHYDAAGNVLVLQHSGIICAEQAGAVGDGTTDNAACFSALIAVAPVKILLSPGKTYLVSSQIDIGPTQKGITFSGTSRGTIFATSTTATIKLGHDGILFDIEGAGTDTFLSINFENIYFNGNAPTRTAGTAFHLHQWARGITFSKCYIVAFYDFGIHAENAGNVQLFETDIFNCGYNIYGDSLADTRVYGGESGSGAGGGATWVIDNIYLLGSSGNTHFINHRPNYSAGVGVRIGGNSSRISFVGGLCDHNLGGGFILYNTCTAIKIEGMDIFDNGTTSAKKPGIDIQTSQGTGGFYGGAAGIEIIGNNIFDRNKGTVNETQDIGINFGTSGSVTYTSIIGNGLNSITTPISPIATVRLKPEVLIVGNNGYKSSVKGVTSSTIDIGSTGVKTVSAIDVSSLGEALHAGSVITLTFLNPTNGDFVGTLFSAFSPGATTFDIKANISTASSNAAATTKIAWRVDNY